jgi:DNA recombination protein RmuC
MASTTTVVVVVVLVAAGCAAILGVCWAHRALSEVIAGGRDELRRLSDRMLADGARLTQRLDVIDGRMDRSELRAADMTTSLFTTLGDVRRHTEAVATQAREFGTLQDLLKAPAPRGGLGEAMLEELLRQVLPPQAFACQHRFRTGVVVDAVVRMAERLVSIDSKFPLSNYRRICEAADDAGRAEAERAFAADVERHIKDIAARYILPDEKTLDFAVMYVPAEGVYGEILRLSHRKRPLFETAIEARVVPMSPLNLYAFLQTVLFGLKCLSIEKSAEAILGHCGRLQRDVEMLAGDYDTLGRHIANARSKHEDGGRRLDRMRDKLDEMVDIAGDAEVGPALEAVND